MVDLNVLVSISGWNRIIYWRCFPQHVGARINSVHRISNVNA